MGAVLEKIYLLKKKIGNFAVPNRAITISDRRANQSGKWRGKAEREEEIKAREKKRERDVLKALCISQAPCVISMHGKYENSPENSLLSVAAARRRRRLNVKSMQVSHKIMMMSVA